MVSRLHSWWQKVKQHPTWLAVIIVASALVIVLIVVVVLGYWLNWHWTGLVAETSEPKHHAKTLWDWLQLLIIPAVLAVAGYAINFTVRNNEQKSTQQRDQTEREIALDNQQEALLQAYLDRMSELLLVHHLGESDVRDQVRYIARARTLEVLSRLDSNRKASLLLFLYESDLIINVNAGRSIVTLYGADISHANLSRANLSEIDLSLTDMSYANLREANLNFANLSQTNLSQADLREANLSYANLSMADLSGANLTGADLTGTILKGIDWSEAIVTKEQMDRISSNQSRRLNLKVYKSL